MNAWLLLWRLPMLLLLAGGGLSLSNLALAVEAEPAPAFAELIKLQDVTGEAHTLSEPSATVATAVVFVSSECPISNSYVPELNRLAEELRQHEGRFYVVLSDATLTRQAAARFAAEFKLTMPVLFDASGSLAAALRPTHVPEAFVLDRQARLVYRGLIDNRYVSVGKQRAQITEQYLKAALTAVIKGQTPQPSATTPIGCLFETPQASDAPAEVTYARDIAPLLQAHCIVCHREGEVAPFPLTSYEDAQKRARWISEITAARQMPPWKVKHDFGRFQDEMRLSTREIELLAAWAAAGAPLGDVADLPPPAKFPIGWQLGEPDLILKMPEAFNVPAEGRDIYQHFVLPIDLPADKMVTAVAFRPGNQRVVHHALFYLDNTGKARELDAADPQPGYQRFGNPGFKPVGSLGGWAPGPTPRFAPAGTGKPLPRGADLVLQVHYHPNGKAESDQSQVGLYFADKPVEHIIHTRMLINTKFVLPAGSKRERVTASLTTPVEIQLLNVFPHMHLLGREMKVTATLPDGRVEPLVWVTDWDWNWQAHYHYVEPLTLPAGTKLELEAYFDNSADNPANPHTPPRDVRWGEQTSDEMCICFLDLIAPKKQGDKQKKP